MPFGLLLTRAIGIDIRTVGSGNIGTTNVLRTSNKGLVAATLLLDAGKGAAAVLARRFGISALLGHGFTVELCHRRRLSTPSSRHSQVKS